MAAKINKAVVFRDVEHHTVNVVLGTRAMQVVREYRVVWNGRFCSPSWTESDPAHAYLDMLKNGQRKPEYLKQKGNANDKT